MKKFLFLFVALSFLQGYAQRETDPVVMTVGGKNVYLSEFMYMLKKTPQIDAGDSTGLSHYVELFKNFKLKVAEAEARGVDRAPEVLNELAECRQAVVANYSTAGKAEEMMARSVYGRMNNVLVYDDIMFRFSDRTFSRDTLAVYKMANEAYQQILKEKDFDKIAEMCKWKPALFDVRQDKYLLPLQQPKEMEHLIASLKVGEVAAPVRSRDGYHILRVTGQVANPGNVQVAHILLADTSASGRTQAETLCGQLRQGADFATLARRHSIDTFSVREGGVLPPFGLGRMDRDFEKAAFALQHIGEISAPVKTQFGYHIIKLLDKKELPSLDGVRKNVRFFLSMHPERLVLQKEQTDSLKRVFGYMEYPAAYETLRRMGDICFPTDSAYIAWGTQLQDTLCRVDGDVFKQSDFVAYLQKNPYITSLYAGDLLRERFDAFVNSVLLAAEDRTLEASYPAFRLLMQEYRDGIMLYAISTAEMWGREPQAEELDRYFEAHQADYAWDEPRFNGCVVYCKDKKTLKKAKAICRKNKTLQLEYLEVSLNNLFEDAVKIERNIFSKGDNLLVDGMWTRRQVASDQPDYPLFFVWGDIETIPQHYTEVKDKVVADYWKFYEKQWLETLAKKYPVTVNWELLKNLK